MAVDMVLAICMGICDKCHEADWLYIPQSKEYGLVCEQCLTKSGMEIDQKATKRNLRGAYPK